MSNFKTCVRDQAMNEYDRQAGQVACMLINGASIVSLSYVKTHHVTFLLEQQKNSSSFTDVSSPLPIGSSTLALTPHT